MKLSINEGYCRKIYGSMERRAPEQSLKICKENGFDTVDFSLGGKTPADNLILRDAYVVEAQRLRDYCDTLGVRIHQTHARYDFHKLGKADFLAQMQRTVTVSSLLGANNIVVHADTWYDPEYRFDFDEVLNTIYEIYAPMVESARKQNIRIAMETLFEDRAPAGKRARFTSQLEELDAIVSRFNDPTVGICWDFGHARVTYRDDQFAQMKKVGSKIISTHVHDNVYDKDLHSMPFLGATDWELGMKTLREIGYTGNLSFELVYGCFPEQLLPDYLHLCRRVGDYLIDRFYGRDAAQST